MKRYSELNYRIEQYRTAILINVYGLVRHSVFHSVFFHSVFGNSL
jgi:hypothetical protein